MTITCQKTKTFVFQVYPLILQCAIAPSLITNLLWMHVEFVDELHCGTMKPIK